MSAHFIIKRVSIKVMSILIWVVYILLFVCTSAVSIAAVSMSKRATNGTPEPVTEDKHSTEEAPPEKPAAQDEPGPPGPTKATEGAHEPAADQHSEDPKPKEGDLVTSGWV